MNSIQLQDNISHEQYQMAVDVLNAIGVKVKVSKNDPLPQFVINGIKQGLQEIKEGKGIPSAAVHKNAMELCMK